MFVSLQVVSSSKYLFIGLELLNIVQTKSYIQKYVKCKKKVLVPHGKAGLCFVWTRVREVRLMRTIFQPGTAELKARH